MKLPLAPHCFTTPSRLVAFFCALVAATFAANLTTPFGKVILTHGTGTSTVTEISYNPDETISLKAEQQGKLAHLGKFTGAFSYVATIDYNTGTTHISGEGTFTLSHGDKLFLSANIVEVGLDYPCPYTGALTVTGGTGRCSGAAGLLEITGVDEESLTDGLVLNGTINTVGSKTIALNSDKENESDDDSDS